MKDKSPRELEPKGIGIRRCYMEIFDSRLIQASRYHLLRHRVDNSLFTEPYRHVNEVGLATSHSDDKAVG